MSIGNSSATEVSGEEQQVRFNGTSLISGLGGEAGFGENVLQRNDDGSTNEIDITSIFEGGLNFFGREFDGLWINNNGSVTFNGPRSIFTPTVITENSGNPEITPFFADVDTRGGETTATPDGNSSGSNLVYYDFDAENDRFIITWDDVGYFANHTDKLNAFQLILSDQGNGDFDIEFRYENIDWTTGEASDGVNGLGGVAARAGFTAGTGNPDAFFELPASGDQDAILALDEVEGNTGQVGQWLFPVRSGDIASADIPPLPDPAAIGAVSGDPHLVTLDGLGYDFQAVGEYVLSRGAAEPGFEIQARFVPIAENASSTSAVATSLGGVNVMIDASNDTPLFVDGVATNIEDFSSLSVGNDRIFREDDRYTFVYAGEDGVVNEGDSRLIVDVLSGRLDFQVRLNSELAGSVEGLLGDGDGDSANDVAFGDGTIVERPFVFEDIYGQYRDDWRVADEANSLFTYLGDAGLESFYDENHPNDLVTIDVLDAGIRAEAELLASEAGLTPGTTSFNNAVLDYALTGDASFIDSALAAPRVASENYVEVTSPESQSEPEPQPEPQPEPVPEPDAGQNTAPVANNDDLAGRFGWLVSGNLLVDNGNGADREPEGDEIVITAIDGQDVIFDTAIVLASGATITVQANGDFVYDHGAAFDASAGDVKDTFEYAIADSQGAESSAVVSVELGEMVASSEVSVIEALYQVAFDREADASGRDYWAGIREGGGRPFDIADFFFESDEFVSEHGDSLGDDDFLTLLYQNAFDRAPDAEGLEYWSEALATEQVDQGDVMVYMASSDEMQTKYLAEGFVFA